MTCRSPSTACDTSQRTEEPFLSQHMEYNKIRQIIEAKSQGNKSKKGIEIMKSLRRNIEILGKISQTVVRRNEHAGVHGGIILNESVGESVARLLSGVDGIHVLAEVDRVLYQQCQTLLELELIQYKLCKAIVKKVGNNSKQLKYLKIGPCSIISLRFDKSLSRFYDNFCFDHSGKGRDKIFLLHSSRRCYLRPRVKSA